MSFSKSLSGTAAACAVALLALADEQRKADEGWHVSAGVVEGHQKQIAAITETVQPVLEALERAPDSVSVSGSVWGHADDTGAGNYGYSLSISGSGSTAAIEAPPAVSTSSASA